MKKRIYFWIMVSGLIWISLNLSLLAWVALVSSVFGEEASDYNPYRQFEIVEAAWVIPLSMVFFGTALWAAARNKEE